MQMLMWFCILEWINRMSFTFWSWCVAPTLIFFELCWADELVFKACFCDHFIFWLHEFLFILVSHNQTFCSHFSILEFCYFSSLPFYILFWASQTWFFQGSSSISNMYKFLLFNSSGSINFLSNSFLF